MELNWAYTEAILNWAMKMMGNVEGESNETILCGESEAMLWHLKDKSKLLTQDFVYWCNQQRLKSKASGGDNLE